MRSSFALLVLIAVPVITVAQQAAPSPVAIGSATEDRHRIDQILGRASADGYLLRSPSSTLEIADGPLQRIAAIHPEFRAIWNSRLPFSLNEGSLWAGRGLNLSLTAGVRLRSGPITVMIAPTIAYMQNADFQVLPSAEPERSGYSSPWYIQDRSMDLPIRFGNQPITRIDPGRSSVTMALGDFALGAAAEHQWWGPGIRNAIVLSNNAPTFPHLFLRTRAPLVTGVGSFEGRWIVGGLSESIFYDSTPDNDHRSLSGLVLTWAPPFEPGLTIGFARTVMDRVGSGAAAPLHAFDFLTRWGGSGGTDQLTSFFFRWLLLADGVETYAEWARLEMPGSIRSFLSAPNHTQGYTLGLQWARPLEHGRILRLQSEVTYLEMSPTYRQRPETPTYYVGRNIEHGYTHRGQVIGAAIGPGSSSQWVAADMLAPAWRLGLGVGRIRWENDTYYRQPTGFSFSSHDVSLFTTLRGGLILAENDVGFEVTAGKRYNYLFQNHLGGFGPSSAFDRVNYTVGLSVAPASPPRAR